jgi:hypothetical protein
MGMNACVLCVGIFNKGIAESLEYMSDLYEDTIPGTLVVSHLLHCNTSEQSKLLAEALGCEPWNFNTHRINKEKVNWPKLYKLAKHNEDWEEREHVDSFWALLKAGFLCIFMPNG